MSVAVQEHDLRHEHQLELEKLYDKHQLFPRVRQAFQECKSLDFMEIIEKHQIDPEFGIDLLAQLAVRKRASIATLIGVLRHHFDTAQEVANELEKCVKAELGKHNISYRQDEQPIHELVVIYEISSRLQGELDKFQYPLPMVVPPHILRTNLDSGYLTGRGSVILQDNHHNQDVCLDHLNRMNQIPLALNLEVAQTIQNKWRNLDRKADDETWEDFQKRKKAFEKYDSVAKEVIGTLLQEGNQVYLTHKYDKRGRTYCQGFHITYQGTDWNKAVIELADKELIHNK